MSDVEGIERCERNGVAGYATEEPTNERFEGHAVARGEFVVADLGELVVHVSLKVPSYVTGSGQSVAVRVEVAMGSVWVATSAIAPRAQHATIRGNRLDRRHPSEFHRHRQVADCGFEVDILLLIPTTRRARRVQQNAAVLPDLQVEYSAVCFGLASSRWTVR